MNRISTSVGQKFKNYYIGQIEKSCQDMWKEYNDMDLENATLCDEFEALLTEIT